MPPVLVVVPDIFFSTRIAGAARALQVELVFAGPAEAVAQCAAAGAARVLVDLHAAGDVPAMIRALKHDPRTKSARVTGFFSHVATQVRDAALAAGIDEALPRSVFVKRLPELLVPSPPDDHAPAAGDTP